MSERDSLFAVAQRESVQSAKIFGNDNRKFDPAIASNLHFGDDAFLRLESLAADAAARESLPHQLERSNAGETLTGTGDLVAAAVGADGDALTAEHECRRTVMGDGHLRGRGGRRYPRYKVD